MAAGAATDVRTEKVVVSALLEPYDQVAGDAYDYAVDGGIVYLAVFDGVGHDLEAGATPPRGP